MNQKKICPICKKEFIPNNGKRVYCYNKACIRRVRANRQNIRRVKLLKKKNKKLGIKENKFTEQKYQYHDKLINYPSPTGKAYIGLSKEPLMPNKVGYGFKGVKVQSENRELIQCSQCGKWLQSISEVHLKSCGKIKTVKEYKKFFGLNNHTALVSDALSIQFSNSSHHNQAWVDSMVRVHKKLSPKFRNPGGKRATMEQLNTRGTCPEQLKARLVEHINRFHRLPDLGRKNKDGFSTHVYYDRFGSFENALKAYGLPIKRGQRGLTEYEFADGTIYFVGGNHMGKEELYEIMLRKCPVLTEKQ